MCVVVRVRMTRFPIYIFFTSTLYERILKNIGNMNPKNPELCILGLVASALSIR